MRVCVELSIWNEADMSRDACHDFLWRRALSPFTCVLLCSRGCLCACGGYKEEIFTVSWVKEQRELRKIPGMAGEGGRLSSGVLAGGVGILMIAAVKSLSSQLSFRSSVRAFRLERLFRHIRSQTRGQKKSYRLDGISLELLQKLLFLLESYTQM